MPRARRAATSTLAVALACALAPAGELSAAPSDAGENKLAILPLLVEGDISEADRGELLGALNSGLERGQFEIVAADAICSDAACVKDVARATSARYVVRSTVRVRDRDYDIRVELLDGETGAPVADSEDGCEICGIADVSNMFSAAAGTLQRKLDALAQGPANLTLTSQPSGALVTVDGQLVGTTPIDQPMVPGKHVLRVSADGFIAIEREITVVEGVSEEINFELEEVPSKLPGRGWGWASLGVGIAALGGGVTLIALHDMQYTIMGECEGENVAVIQGKEECRFLFNTKWYGMASLIAGAALTTLGAVILIESSDRSKVDRGSKKRRASAGRRTRVGVGPGSVVVQGRF